MKNIYTLIVLLITSFSQAQSNYVSTYLDNPEYNAFELHSLPWDETRLFQFTRNYLSGHFVYTIDQVAVGTISPVVPPLCSEILRVPEILDDGVLLVGSTASGKELVFYDETNSTVFDLNVGSGDSDPFIQRMNDRVFIVAFDGTERQLFEFDQVSHTVSQVTNNAAPVESVCAVWGDKVYYRTKTLNTAMNLDEYNLMMAEFNGTGFSHQIAYTIAVPSTPDRMVDWILPQLFQGNLYLMGVNVALNGSTNASYTHGIIIVDANNQISTPSLVLPNTDGIFQMVQWDGKLGVFSDLHDTFYSSTDGLTFQSEAVPVNGRLVEYHVSENDKLYLNCLYIDETREIFQFDNGFQSKFFGGHIHFLSEHDETVYCYEYSDVDSSSIVLIYTAIDVVDEVQVHTTFHSPHINSSTFFGGYFTFLFGSEGGVFDDNDIFQLTGSPSAGVDDLEIEFSLYPNPVSTNDILTLSSEKDGEALLVNSTGKVLKQFDIAIGENELKTSFLSSGVYFISFMNHTQRFVVN